MSIVLRFWRRYLEALFKNTEETCQYIIHSCQNAKKNLQLTTLIHRFPWIEHDLKPFLTMFLLEMKG